MTTTVISEIPLDKVQPDPDNPRENFDGPSLAKLADSIASVGLLEPILVRQNGSEDTFVIIAGERRWRAHNLLVERGDDVTTIRAIVEESDDAGAAIRQVVENLQRENLDPIEEARGFMRLAGFDMKQKDIAAAVGCTVPHVSKRLKLLSLPEKAHKALRAKDLTIEEALKLADIADPAKVDDLLDHGWHYGELDRVIAQQERDAKRQKLVDKVAKAHPDLLVVTQGNWAKVEEQYPSEFHEHRQGAAVDLDELAGATPPEHAVGVVVDQWANQSELRWAIARPKSKTHAALYAKITEALESGEDDQVTAATEALEKFRAKQEKARAAAAAKQAAANPYMTTRNASPEVKAAAREAKRRLKAQAEHKRDFLADLVAKAPKALIVNLVLRWMAIHEINHDDAPRVCRLLGLEADEKQVPKQSRWDAKAGKYVTPEGTRTERNWHAPIQRYLAEGGEKALLRTAAACLFSRLNEYDWGIELTVDDTELYGNFEAWLAEQGFEPLSEDTPAPDDAGDVDEDEEPDVDDDES